MANSVHALFQALAHAGDERELRLRFMDMAGEHFGVQRWGIYLFDEQSRLAAVDVCGVANVDAFVECYEKVGRAVDPVLSYVVERHAPAHEELVLPPGGWKQCELYQRCCAYYDHEHIMTGPIVGSCLHSFVSLYSNTTDPTNETPFPVSHSPNTARATSC